MKKAELANQEGRRQRVAPGNAADQMDRVVNQIVRALRSGRPAELPGLGTIQPGKRWKFLPERRKGVPEVTPKSLVQKNLAQKNPGQKPHE
jgi:nucleoid DNA-binding protein